jgi:GNAT superfamily N-acetyltransferase
MLPTSSTWKIRLARLDDIPALDILIPLSVRALQINHYNEAQREAAIGPVFGVDRQLIEDQTYFVAETPTGEIIGCGGWSKRQTKCGSSAGRTEPDPLIDPQTDAARIRAFFVHPNFARRGIGRAILDACEKALLAAGFTRAEIAATLTGEALYVSGGYRVTEYFDIQLSNDLPLPCVRLTKNFPSTPRSLHARSATPSP